ncbi:hypothetical protein LTR09_004039 [Extremus antarcticus]|uniref:BTB domain-containing protein n=1 Tax=Extremus antarcticus TaxID=702011 RepID=A0AAJ0DJ11_9PEZI|nr:hypothetical protein LTR09_004039 [Extremus antarcticus]
MAASFLVPAIPPPESPSPTPSDSSTISQPDLPEPMPLRRNRVRRTPSRVPLRMGFRTMTDMATVLVGEPNDKTRPETKYIIHKDLLTSASPFFAAALNGTFAEGLDQTVRLPEEKPEIFEWFLQWLYTGTLKTPTPHCDRLLPPTMPHLHPSSGPHALISHQQHHHLTTLTAHDIRTDGDLRNTHGSPKYFLLLDLYALSDRLLTTPLSNHILTTIARLSESTNSVPTPSDTWILYSDTAIRDTSPLRTLVLDLFAYKKTDRLLETHKDEWHPRFLRDLCVKLKRPGPEAIARHELVLWKPRDWDTTRACEGCRAVVQPGGTGERCIGCEKVFCGRCLRDAQAQAQGQGSGKGGLMDTGGCKPWSGRGMCERYHEHQEGEGCE